MKNKLQPETIGMLYGLLGVIGFSLTLPATRIAVSYFSPTVVGLGRALVAALLAALVLSIKREKLPTWQQWKGLAIVAVGVIVGFPLLSAWAMTRVPASHGAVIIALLPLVTAGFAAIRVKERPSNSFWLSSTAGCMVVLGYAVYNGLGEMQLADVALLGAGYLQPFLTILGSSLLLHEEIGLATIGVAILVVFIVAQGRKAPIKQMST